MKPAGQKASNAGNLALERDYFRALEQVFDRACSTAGLSRRYFDIGSKLLCLEFAGPALESILTRALSHLEVFPPSSPFPPDLTIAIWDSESTSTSMPAPLYDHTSVATTEDFFLHYQLGADTFHFFLPDSAKALYWVRSPSQIPWWETVSPLRIILNQWFEIDDRLILHASAVATHHGGALLAGAGGSGKSTTALSCLAHGLQYGADDLLLVSNDERPKGFCLYSTAKLRRETYTFLPQLAAYETVWDNSEPDKAVFFLAESFRESIARDFALNLILLPRIVDAERTTFVAASPLQALRALAPSSIFLIPGSGERKFAQMSRFVRKIPAFHLLLGRDHDRIPGEISRMIGES